jgi:predicted nuclease of predicted toxin-antitoxin system
MKFLVDAQLPFTLKAWLISQGFDTIHTADLPKQNLSTDTEIVDIAVREDRILISKDSDFLKLKILSHKPRRLLLITTGNIANRSLRALIEKNFVSIYALFESFEVVELGNSFVVGRNID